MAARGIDLGMSAMRWDPVCTRPEGLVEPSRVDRTGKNGPTWRAVNGPRWRWVAPGLYVPSTVETLVEQRIVEQAARLRPNGRSGCVTGWAALRWRGAAFFDGLAPGGEVELPVPLSLGSAGAQLRPAPGCVLERVQLAPAEREVVAGLPVTSTQRALFDEVRRRSSLWSAVEAIDMAAAAGLISVWLFATYVGDMNSRNGAPLARHAVSLAVDESRSPRETWFRLVWTLLAGLPEPLVNEPVYDHDGRLIGIPDLLDPVAGLVGEYDGAHHKSVEQHRRDVRREEDFRDHGLECVTVVRGDSRNVAATRVSAARGRAKFLPRESCAWTLERPARDPRPETLDERLERLGLVSALTRS